MIKIKDYIFNENEIEYIKKELEGIIVCPKAVNVELKAIENATFEDIEWNYENNNEYCNVFYEDRIKELEEENERLKELNVCVGCNNNPDYKSRIDEAIKYIKDNVAVYSFGNKSEDYAHWEFDDSNIQDLLQILNTEEK